ncbi:MAG TPA: neutral/alkaline non-lysosomal ceramidase N-terminal domain-containing protein [Acidobacteriota bacterium]|nr:neutral/alkaline non-lysosomal ceramidase N-terminal domain-containing protein [Acidobacteriota bacterium]
MRKPWLFLLVLTVVLSVVPLLGVDFTSLKVGVAKTDITPEHPIQMAGYAGRKGLSTGVHDPLSARAIVFELDKTRLAFVTTDLLGFYAGTAEPLREAILAKTGLRPAELFLSAIHTHAGPSLTLDPEKGHANNVKYTQQLRQRLPVLVESALANLQSASITVGEGASPIGANRRELHISPEGESSIVLGRNAYGPTDKQVLVLRILKTDGQALATLFDYATHATSLGPQNYLISGDVLGLAEQVIERISDSGGFAAAFAGASGNIDPWYRVLPGFNTEPGWTPEPVLLGTLLGQEVVHAYRAAIEPQRVNRIRAAVKVLQLPAKATPDSTAPPAQTLPFVITAARIGDVGFIGLGGEVLTEIGLAIKAGSPFRHTFVITHCNGAAGYLVPRHLFVEGGYEVRSTRFAPSAADMVVRESIRLLHSLDPAE